MDAKFLYMSPLSFADLNSWTRSTYFHWISVTFQEEPGRPPAEPAFVERVQSPPPPLLQPTPTSSRMYSMSVESVTDTKRILWTDGTTSPLKPAEQTAWLTSCLHNQPLTFTLHRLPTRRVNMALGYSRTPCTMWRMFYLVICIWKKKNIK